MTKKASPGQAMAASPRPAPLPQSGGAYVLEDDTLKPALNEASTPASNAPETEG